MDASLLAVRPATIADADQIADVHVDSIHGLGAKAYDRDVVEVWGARRGTASGIEQQSSRANFSSSPWRAAKCWAFPPTAWKTASIERQFTSAAVLRAEDFYRSCGFQELGVGEHLLPSGVAMACVFMRKTLGAPTPSERRSVS